MVRMLMVATYLLIAGTQPINDEAKKEAEKLEGTWAIVSGDDFRKGEKWVVENGQIQEAASSTVYRFYRLDPRKTPKEIDITVMAQPDGTPLMFLKGIYALEGDEWKLCLADDGKERSVAFPRTPSPGQMLVLKRQKP